MSSDIAAELEQDDSEPGWSETAKCLGSSSKIHDSMAKGAGAGLAAGAVDPKYGPAAAAGVAAADLGVKSAFYTVNEDGEYEVRDGIKDFGWPALGVAGAVVAEEALDEKIYEVARGAFETAHGLEDHLEEFATDVGLSLPDEQIYNGIIEIHNQSPEIVQNMIDAAPESAGAAVMMPAFGVALGAAAYRTKEEIDERTSSYLEGNPVYEKAREFLNRKI